MNRWECWAKEVLEEWFWPGIKSAERWSPSSMSRRILLMVKIFLFVRKGFKRQILIVLAVLLM
jgi:hypothetical protein